MIKHNSAKFKRLLQSKRPAPTSPRVVFGASYKDELYRSAIQTTGLCRLESRVSAQYCRGSPFSSRALKIQAPTVCAGLRAMKHVGQQKPKYHASCHRSSPREAPHAHFQEARDSSQCLTSPYSPVQGVKH